MRLASTGLTRQDLLLSPRNWQLSSGDGPVWQGTGRVGLVYNASRNWLDMACVLRVSVRPKSAPGQGTGTSGSLL